MTPHILVTGATGTVGREVVNALRKQGSDFVAGVRNENKAKDILGPNTYTAYFDFEQPATFERATQNVDRVFLLGPPINPQLDELVNSFINHLDKRGIRRIVYLSALGAESLEGLPFHANVERKLKHLNTDWTILQPSFFSQNFRNYEYENITERSITYMPAGEGKAGFVDVRDIGEVAAKVLTNDAHIHQTYVLTGPEALSYHQAAQLLTEVLGKSVHYPAPDPDTFASALMVTGAPNFVAEYMNEIYGLIRDGKADHVSNTVERIVGRSPTSLREVLQRTFS